MLVIASLELPNHIRTLTWQDMGNKVRPKTHNMDRCAEPLVTWYTTHQVSLLPVCNDKNHDLQCHPQNRRDMKHIASWKIPEQLTDMQPPQLSASYLVQVNQLRGVKISINVAKNYRILPQNVDLYVRHDYLLTVLHSLSLRGPVLVLRAENECTTTGEGYIGPSTSLSLDNLREYIARKTTTVVKHNWNCVQARKWVAVLLFSGIILPNMAIVRIGRYAQSYDRIQDTRTLYYLPWESLLQSKWN